MKQLLKPTMVAVAVMAMMGCQEKQQEAEKAQAVKLETPAQKQAYAIGSSMGTYLTKTLEQQQEYGFELDKELIILGLSESLNDKSQLTQEEVEQTLMAFEQEVRAKQEEVAKVEAEKNLTDGQAFMAENAKVEGVKVTESGLQYQVLTAGEGEKPEATDTVKVHYKGTLIDGEEFDSSYSRGEPIEFALNRVIKGWTEGVQLMNVGSKYKFVIPADLAYGANGTGPIPANSTLVFEVELLDIIKPEAAEESDK
ncbi:FKBP-type peptidyl-prolyl cis-trans isomerase [Thalassotalea mangrovi]|uniref:Peptidyl-prolyl cis-trans isomerase n=1 Tax=Thalassotalea mangrovi TaxID=2572245 RepID=A0A4U1B5B3_9GAMM|nr:FKBP-type peptidyl-prolyl cis-trans isomerase [Thalassotalea mangrovi]TKB45486.1 FKBP-type peptidyl-prolyl cis-trans isomerase [Thalassotalea mangrovi]